MASKTPLLIEPYLGLPTETSLLVLSGILGASTNWLVLRHLYSYLRGGANGSRNNPEPEGSASFSGGDKDDRPPAVLLVSFLRDYGFWKDSAGRMGLDLTALSRKGRFGFVDGLTGLFTPPEAAKAPLGLISSSPNWPQLLWDNQIGVDGIKATIRASVDTLRASSTKLMLVIDQPDLLLAATEATVSGLHDMILELRESVHAALVTLSVDEPLIGQQQQTTLERTHASLVLSLAHEADVLLALRLLDTGTAHDVSGVLRITRGGASSNHDGKLLVEEHEYLYHISGDGGVRVFERGQ